MSQNASSSVPTAAAAALKAIASIRRQQAQFADAVDAYRRIVVLDPLPSVVPATILNRPSLTKQLLTTYLGQYQSAMATQREIVIVYLEAGDYDSAVSEAKALLSVTRAIPKFFTVAVDVATWTLKAKEGHLSLANRFIRFQNLGPAGPDKKRGTEDDLECPLPRPEEGAGQGPLPKVIAEAISGIPARTPEDHRHRGYLALYGGDPAMALREFRAAYRKCDMAEAAMKQTVDDLALALAALNGHSTEAQPLFDFQQYGPAGKDGKPGTPDDLKDPLAKY